MEQGEFVVPKEKQLVRVSLVGGGVFEGHIFLECGVEARTLHRKVLAFLGDEKDFVPFAIGDETEFFSKLAIRMVEIDREEEQDASLTHAEPVTVIFRDGPPVDCELIADVPEDRRRLSDILNLPGSFVCARIDENVCYINKQAILKVLSAGD